MWYGDGMLVVMDLYFGLSSMYLIVLVEERAFARHVTNSFLCDIVNI